MTEVEKLAAFVVRASFDELSQQARQELKIRVLDAQGCAIGALAAEPVQLVRGQVQEFGGSELCTMIGGGRTAPDRAALYNSFLVRYLDYNDRYLAKHETCHPSDNLGAVLAASEYAGGCGRDLLASLAVADQVQCRLSDVAPLRSKGFDHTTQGSYAVAAGVARALGLDQTHAAHAIGIAGTAFNALRVSRTGSLSHWKGLAYPNTAFGATHAAFLAMRGVTGPLEVLEGNKGFMDSIAGHFEIDWAHEDLERVRNTIVKKYNAEIHSQTSVEGILELKHENGFTAQDVQSIDIEIFDVAYHIIGGGDEGDKTLVETKEQADHSLPYLIAVALLDDCILPEQYRPERIRSEEVQSLLRRVSVKPLDELSGRFPNEMPCRITVSLTDGTTLVKEKTDYEGFYTRPMRWESVVRKFRQLSTENSEATLQEDIIGAVADLEAIQVADLTRLLSRVHRDRSSCSRPSLELRLEHCEEPRRTLGVSPAWICRSSARQRKRAQP